MAKKKKRTTHHRPRSRRMGGVTHGINNEIMEALGLVGAAVLGPALQKSLTSIPMKVVSGVQALVGWKMKNSPHPLMRGAGWGFFGTGVIGLTHEFGVIHGVEDFINGIMDNGEHFEEIPNPHSSMYGISNSSTMSGISNGSTMSGNSGMEYHMDPLRDMM
jgi:hypothetical protein